MSIAALDASLTGRPRILWALVLALGVVGALLRFQGVGDQSFTSEEIFEVLWTEGTLGDLWDSLAQDRRSPPLYHLILMPFTHAGEGAMMAVRLPSVILGSLVPLVLFAWLRAACGPTAAVAAMALMVFSPLHVRFSQDATPYSLLTLATLGASAALWMCARSPHRTRWLVLYALSLWAALWTHYLATLMVAAHLIWIWLDWLFHRSPGDARRAWTPPGVTVVCLTGIASLHPRLMELWMEMEFWTGSETGFPFAGWSVRNTFALLGAFTFGTAAGEATVAMGVVSLILLLIGVIRLLRSQPSLAAFLVLISAGNAAAVIGLCAAHNHWFGERFVLLSLPAHIALLAVGLTTVIDWLGLLLARTLHLRTPTERAIAAGGISLAVLVAGGAMAMRLIITRPHLKPEWREAAEWIAENMEPGVPILAAHPWDLFSLEHHLELIQAPVRTELLTEGDEILARAEALGECLILLPAWDLHRPEWGSLSVATPVDGFRGMHLLEWSEDPQRWVERRLPMIGEFARAFREGGDRLDFGKETYAGVGPGWWPPEYSALDEGFRWSALRRSTVLLPFSFPRGESLVARMKTLRRPGMPAQEVEIAVNGVPVGRGSVEGDWATFSVTVPNSIWSPGPNIVEFIAQELVVPAELFGGEDRRAIGIAIDWIGLGDSEPAQHDWTSTIALAEEPRLADAAADAFSHLDHRVDIGSEPFGTALPSDWHAPEMWQGNLSVRWSRRERAEAVLPLEEPGAWDLLFRATTLDWPGAPPQTTEISVNGERVGELIVQSEWTVHRIAISGEPWRSGLNSVVFEVDHIVSPEAVLGVPDPRPLGIALDWIQLVEPATDEAATDHR